MKNRRKFLKDAGSTALFTTLGSSFFISCDETNDTATPPPDNNNNNESEEGFTVDGNVYMIDLTHTSFSNLQNSGGWKRFDEGGMLIVNVGQGIVRAFSNSCPHQGCRTSWGYTNQNFKCGCHNAIFSNSGNFITGPNGTGDLSSYTASVNNDILTITK